MANLLEIIIEAKDKASAELSKINGQLVEADKKSRKASEGFDKLAGSALKVGTIMTAAGAAIVGAMWKMTDSYTKAGEEIYNMSIRTGVGIEALSELKYMAEQSGTSLAAMETSIRMMQRSLVDGTAATSITQLGLSISVLMGLKPEEQFWEIANALSAVADPTKRAAMAMDIFGRSGTDLLPILADGQAGIDAMKQKASDLGVVFSTEAAIKAKNFQDATDNLKTSLAGLGGAISEAVSPQLENFINNLTTIVTKITDWARANPELVTTLLKIGGILAIGGIIMVGIVGLYKAIMAVNVALAFMAGLSGVGWIAIASGVAAAAAVAIGMNAMLSAPDTSTPGASRSFAKGGIVPGPLGQPTPIIAHGGEMFLGAGNNAMPGGNTVNVYVAGSVVAERDLAEVVRRVFYDIKRNNFSLEMT
jgi:TP901 family phage tail tape measure protein